MNLTENLGNSLRKRISNCKYKIQYESEYIFREKGSGPPQTHWSQVDARVDRDSGLNQLQLNILHALNTPRDLDEASKIKL